MTAKRPSKTYFTVLFSLLTLVILILIFLTSQAPIKVKSAAPAVQPTSTPPAPKIIDRRLLGQSIDFLSVDVLAPPAGSASNKYLSVIVANSLRGPGNGLPADFYNWQDPYGFHDPSRRRTWTPTPTPQSPNPATPTPSPTTWGRYYISQPAELSDRKSVV